MLGEAFLLRPGEEYLSANWLEHFHADHRAAQLAGVRRTLLAKGRNIPRTSFFAVLNVGAAVERCRQELNLEIRFVVLGERRDPSHAGILGLPEEAEETARVLAQAVGPAEVYPAGEQS